MFLGSQTNFGIITEFIGATFLFIYKSTVEQAIRYTSSLERINSVGMSMQILDTIKQSKETLVELTQAKISISKLLLMQANQAQLEDGEVGKKTRLKKVWFKITLFSVLVPYLKGCLVVSFNLL